MSDFLTNLATELFGRIDGPMRLRFVIDPLVAAFFAVRAGLRDARENKPPFFWALATRPDHRREMLRQGWKDIAKLFVGAAVADVVYQYIELKSFQPVAALAVAIVLVIMPYLLLRAPVTRIAAKWGK